MTRENNMRFLLLSGLIFCALGGFLLHFIIHPPMKSQTHLIPFVSGLTSVIIVPLLFAFRKTIHYGYVLNGMTAILGTITMAHFSVWRFPAEFAWENLILKTLAADIFILWGKFFFGKALFDLQMFGAEGSIEQRGIWYRYPNLGWWGVHLVAISAVYTVGQLAWR